MSSAHRRSKAYMVGCLRRGGQRLRHCGGTGFGVTHLLRQTASSVKESTAVWWDEENQHRILGRSSIITGSGFGMAAVHQPGCGQWV